MRDFKKTFFLFKKPGHAQQAGYFVKAEKPLYERTPLPDGQALFAKLIQSFTVLRSFKTFMG